MPDFHTRPASPRSRVAATTTALLLRPVLDRVPDNRFGVLFGRQFLARTLAAFGPPLPGTDVAQVDERTPAGRVRGEWVRGPRASRTDGALLYIHGSGYTLCSPKTHRGLTSRLSSLTGLSVFSVDYRLAPEHPFPAAADDVRRAWDWLTEQHHPAGRLAVAADSAGGHLAVDLSLLLLREDRPLPAGQALFSPLADLTFELSHRREQFAPDPMVSARRARAIVAPYVGDTDPLDARLTLVPEPGEALPPTLIQAGGLEMLAADAHHLADTLTATGTACRLEVWPGQMHVFQALPRLVPEAGPALSRAATFLEEALMATRVPERRTA